MAEYLILIFEDENAYATATPDVFQQVMDAHNRFAGQVGEKGGKIIEGRALQPTPAGCECQKLWSRRRDCQSIVSIQWALRPLYNHGSEMQDLLSSNSRSSAYSANCMS